MTDSELTRLLNTSYESVLKTYEDLTNDRFSLTVSAQHPDVPVRALTELRDARRRLFQKWPEWSELPLILTRQMAEQASRSETAAFKATLVDGVIGDICAGMGADTVAFHRAGHFIYYNDADSQVSCMFQHNQRLFAIPDISVSHLQAEEWLTAFDASIDTIYLDPDRRPDRQSRKLQLAAYQPDVIAMQQTLLNRAPNVWVKVSPMVDIADLRRQFEHLDEVFVLSVQNEVRELLFCLRRARRHEQPRIHAACFDGEQWTMYDKAFFSRIERPVASHIGQYLIDPDKAVTKAQLVDRFAERHQLKWVHASTDLLTTDAVPTAPARVFKVIDVIPYKTKTVRSYLKINGIDRATVIRRNFPDRPDHLRNEFKLKESAKTALIFTRNAVDQLICVVTDRV